MTGIPFEAILEGARYARYFTVVAPLTAWGTAAYSASIGLLWLAIPVMVLAMILSLPHAIAHWIAARDLWHARNKPTGRRTAPAKRTAR